MRHAAQRSFLFWAGSVALVDGLLATSFMPLRGRVRGSVLKHRRAQRPTNPPTGLLTVAYIFRGILPAR